MSAIGAKKRIHPRPLFLNFRRRGSIIYPAA
jgi:hypothetical protein